MTYTKHKPDYNTTSPVFVWPTSTSGYSLGDALISAIDLVICQWVQLSFLCQIIDIFGTVTNIINIVCFLKQGFKDPVSVSLFGLAISDLGCLIPLIWANICLTPALMDVDLPFDPVEFQYLTGTWPHLTFARVSAWMTALIVLERCLCVTIPLQVKNLVTPTRVTIITICVFTVLIASVAPVYVVNGFSFQYNPARNKSILGLVFTVNRETVDSISYVINNIFLPFIAFVLVILCTLIIVFKLNTNTKWRSKSTTNTQDDHVSSRNKKVAKMVVMISTLFIICFSPLVVLIIIMAIEPELSIRGKYRKLVFVLGGLSVILESVNSSMNIFIYYHMSSKYKAIFHQLFCVEK